MAGQSSTLRVELVGDKEILITRQFDFPRALVFEAFSKCEHLANWLGPSSMTMSSCDMAFEVGGKYRFIHSDGAGNEYAFRGELREIDPPARVVRTFEFEMFPGHISVETLTLDEREGKTYLTVRSQFDTKEDRDGMAQSGMEAGVRDSYDRLEAYVANGLKAVN
jgi:uncharacterized protein YndB with AHSA1/START domain